MQQQQLLPRFLPRCGHCNVCSLQANEPLSTTLIPWRATRRYRFILEAAKRASADAVTEEEDFGGFGESSSNDDE